MVPRFEGRVRLAGDCLYIPLYSIRYIMLHVGVPLGFVCNRSTLAMQQAYLVRSSVVTDVIFIVGYAIYLSPGSGPGVRICLIQNQILVSLSISSERA